MSGRTTGRGRANADGAWKRVLTDLLPQVLELTVPELYRAVNWSVPTVSLDKEFQAVVRRAAIGPRVADTVVQLRLLSGETTWLVLHVEVQGQPEGDFAERMCSYYALLHLRLRRQRAAGAAPPLILGLALLTDDNATWRPQPYEARAFAQGVRYDYWAVKLLEWGARTDELAASANPFAVIVQAWLGILAARGRVDDLASVARAVFRRMRRGGYSNEAIGTMLAFLEQVLVTSQDRQELLAAILEELEDEPMAQVMSRWERSAIRKGLREGRQLGREEGREETTRELLMQLLTRKFGPLTKDAGEQIRALPGEQLLALYDVALDFTDRAQLDQWLADNAAR